MTPAEAALAPLPTPEALAPDPEALARFWRMVQTPIQSKQDLQAWCWRILRVWVSDVTCCPDQRHRAPLDAMWYAYSAEGPRCVWKASRGLGGKTAMLAALSLAEAITLKAGVSLLGGSGEQSERVHAYMTGQDMEGAFWRAPYAPRHLLKTDPSKRRTELDGGGYMYALMASQASVRGAHPNRLRGDEIDEMAADIWDAAAGQPMTREAAGGHTVRQQIVGCSTHQNAKGTMTRELKMARERGWPVFEWCWRANLRTRRNPRGWLTQDMVIDTMRQVTRETWRVEHNLGEPSIEGRAVETSLVERMFRRDLDDVMGGLGTEIRFEDPDPDGSYVAGADWGKRKDKSIFIVLRTDVTPARIVAYAHRGREPYPKMIARYNRLVRDYDANACHDETGIGTVIDDYMESEHTEGVTLRGGRSGTRREVIDEYIMAIERGEIEGPMIEYMYEEHKLCTLDDLWGKGHLPDTFAAGALAWWAYLFGGLAIA